MKARTAKLLGWAGLFLVLETWLERCIVPFSPTFDRLVVVHTYPFKDVAQDSVALVISIVVGIKYSKRWYGVAVLALISAVLAVLSVALD